MTGLLRNHIQGNHRGSTNYTSQQSCIFVVSVTQTFYLNSRNKSSFERDFTWKRLSIARYTRRI